jgi:shikimate dehydrogenase
VLIPPPAEVQTRCAVLGSPIAHSLSPALHRAAYQALGLAWTYEAVQVAEHELGGFVAALDESWRGLSLTMPLKRAALPLLDELSGVASMAGAVNTVVLAGARRYGDNTDVPGAAAALRERYGGPVAHAVVLGGGATATSVLLALADLGCTRAHLLVRDPARAADTVAAIARHPQAPSLTVARLGELDHLADDLPRADVVVSTVPVDAQTPPLVAQLSAIGPGAVFDVVYDPWPTPLVRAADGRSVVVHGLDLLAHQAALQVRLMTGHDVPVDVLRSAALASLGLE